LAQLTVLLSETARQMTEPRKQEPQPLPLPQEEQSDVENANEPSGHQGKIKELREGGLFVEHDLSPFSLAAYVGQEAIKNDLRERIEKVKRDPERQFPHLLLSGPPEMGKRTLALTIARELGVDIVSCAPTLFNVSQGTGQLASVLLTNLEAGGVLLIEDIESLNKAVLSQLLSAIEDRTFDLVIGQGSSRRSVPLTLPPFTLVGTTSKPAQVDRSLRRWLLVKDFAPYDIDQISELVMMLAEQQGLLIFPDAAELLAGYCDGSVGNARVLVKRVQDYARNPLAVTPEIAREALVSFGYLDQSLPSIDLATKLQKMTGPDFEEFVATVFRGRGYAVELTPGSGDHGIDLLMRKGHELVAVQCKRWSAPVGEPVVRDFFGSLINAGAQLGFVVTTSNFTTQAFTFAQGKPLQLLDLDALVELVAQTGGSQVKS
jgi:Holliday junction DNA helicase RuvB